MGSINSIQVSDVVKERQQMREQKNLTPGQKELLKITKVFDDGEVDFVNRWNRGLETGDERDFGDRLISAVQDIGGEVGNFFNSSVDTKREKLTRIERAKDEERADNEKRVRMLINNTERGLAANEVDTPAQGQRPGDFTADTRIFNTNLGDKK